MGTVVLFPQDCLPIPKSRQSGSFSDAFHEMWMPFDSTSQLFGPPISHSDPLRSRCSPDHVAGHVYPRRTRSSCSLHPLQRDFERRKSKPKRPGDPKVGDTNILAPTPSFIDLDNGKELRMGTTGSGTRACKIGNNVLQDGRKKTGSNIRKDVSDLKSTMFQGTSSQLLLQDSVASPPVDSGIRGHSKEARHKPNNVMKRFPVRLRSGCDDSFMLLTELNQVAADEGSAEQKHGPLHASSSVCPDMRLVNQASGVHEPSIVPARLRRASTDPELVEHMGHYKSQMLQAPGGIIRTIARTSSLPPSERWAGPAFSAASPAPSSLPLPKISLLGQKMVSSRVSSTIDQGKAATCQELGLVSKIPVLLHVKEQLDAAFATMSLRRMLKLDPF